MIFSRRPQGVGRKSFGFVLWNSSQIHPFLYIPKATILVWLPLLSSLNLPVFLLEGLLILLKYFVGNTFIQKLEMMSFSYQIILTYSPWYFRPSIVCLPLPLSSASIFLTYQVTQVLLLSRLQACCSPSKSFRWSYVLWNIFSFLLHQANSHPGFPWPPW